MLAVFLKPPTIIVIPIVFALYDIYAVFRGPLKSIVNSSDDSLDLRPLFVSLDSFVSIFVNWFTICFFKFVSYSYWYNPNFVFSKTF